VGVYIVLATLVAPAGRWSQSVDSADPPTATRLVAMAFGWTLFVIPFLFVFSGTLLLKGDPLSIAVDLSLAVAASGSFPRR